MKARHFISANFSKLLLSALFGLTISLTCAAQEKIAFTSNIGGNNNIWLMNASGSNRVQLTTDIGSDSYPNISKDGTKIVFVSDRDGNPEIYSMNSAGSFQTRLTNNAGTDSEPVFSPDGTKIVFSSNRDGNHEIYIMNADGSGQTRLTTNTVDDGQAEFSPDGTKIIFSRLAANQSDAHIITMDLNGANQVPLTSGSFILNGQPSFSPNGQKIVFSSVRPLSHTNPEIYLMDANGSNQTRVTTAVGQDMEPVYSPNGSKIAFRSERDGNAEIYTMNADGTNQVRITFDGAGTTNFAPSWANVPLANVDIPDDLAREQGATLTVPITVSDTTGMGIISYDFALHYDPAVLQPLANAVDKTGTLSAGFQEVNAGTGALGTLIVSGFGSLPLVGAGTLINLKFDVIGTPPTSSSLTLSPFMFNEGIPYVEVSAGQVFVQGTVRGRVTYGNAATPTGVSNVSLLAAGAPNTSTTTAADGTYVLGGFGPGSYTITPSKVGEVNGIEALDASRISQFLIGAVTLTSNQQTAAEVSGNGSVTSFDAALIAQYLVGLPNTGQTGTWRFVPSSRTYLTVGSLTGEDYSAILLGDVSGNWTPSPGAGFSERRLEAQRFGVNLSLPTVKARKGEKISIDVTMGVPLTPVEAYQFDIFYDPSVLQAEASPVETAGTLSESFAAVSNSSQPGRLRLAVYGPRKIAKKSGTLLTLKFRVIGQSNSDLVFAGVLVNDGNPAASTRNGKVAVRR